VKAALAGELVIFAGAGTSTENPLTLPSTLYVGVVGELGYTATDDLPSFPRAMSQYEKQHGRPALLQKAKERFDYIDGFGDLRAMATRFHQEISTMFMVDTIVTTNWDTYFEEDCGAIPIVTEADYAFWNLPGRKVFKVHGSMNNVGSIVATEDDYERCYAQLREGVMGSTLKHMLATKTTVFLGYSFRDDDFNQIYDLVRHQLGAMLPRPIVVTLNDEFDAISYRGADVIVTDAAFSSASSNGPSSVNLRASFLTIGSRAPSMLPSAPIRSMSRCTTASMRMTSLLSFTPARTKTASGMVSIACFGLRRRANIHTRVMFVR